MREQKFKKNIPNILTTLRLMLVPLFFVMLTSNEKYSYLFALVIFCFAAITDYLDGKLARKFDAVSKFGLFMDPLADKALVISAFVGFLYIEALIPAIKPWMVFLIFFRDFLVTLLRIMIKRNGSLMVTSGVAKMKTASQLISIIIILLLLSFSSIYQLDLSLNFIWSIMILVTLFTLYTGFDYYYRNIKLISFNK
tara:strand:+ start:872 stop:1459 length:588 start_codon:yes stop_codon:yes gene_type:complete